MSTIELRPAPTSAGPRADADPAEVARSARLAVVAALQRLLEVLDGRRPCEHVAATVSSKLGALLDPAADRLYVIIIPICFGIREFVPWWLIGLIIGRDVVLFATAPLLRSRGVTALPTLYIGKAATFALMSAFPWLLAGQIDGLVGDITFPIGWAFLLWGVGLYLWSLVLYWIQTITVLRTMPRVAVTA